MGFQQEESQVHGTGNKSAIIRIHSKSGKNKNFTLKQQTHLHYLTVRMVGDGQVTIIKNHQVDFRQL